MLWHKAWLETRGASSARGHDPDGDGRQQRLRLPGDAEAAAEPQRRRPKRRRRKQPGWRRVIREAIEIQKDFRGFIWYQAFRDNLTQMGVFFAVLLGCGGLLHESSKGSALFTLSLPVTRKQLLGARTGTGLAQLLAISMVPPLAISILAPTDRPAIQHRRRARARRLHLLRRGGVLQPGVVPVDAVRRHLAADADRDRHRVRDGVRIVRRAATRHLQRDERRVVLQERDRCRGRDS